MNDPFVIQALIAISFILVALCFYLIHDTEKRRKRQEHAESAHKAAIYFSKLDSKFSGKPLSPQEIEKYDKVSDWDPHF